MIEGVIFDWDGVLLDSEPLFKRVEHALLREAWETSGRPGAQDVDDRITQLIRDMSGMGAAEAIQLCQQRLALTGPLEELLASYRQRVAEVYPQSPLIPHALETVRRMRPHARLAVATSSAHALVDPVLERTGIRPLLDAVVTVDDVGGIAKPAPDVYLAAARAIGVPPARCLAIEDTAVGTSAATTAGCRCIAIPRRETVFADFTPAHRVARSLQDLTLEFIEALDQPVDPEEAGLPVVVYARAVPGRHARVLLHLQQEAGAALARERGWKVEERLADEDPGGNWWDRAGLQQVLDLADRRLIHRVVVAEPGALAAGTLEQAEIVRRLGEHAVRVRSVFRKEPYALTAALWN
jgi:HAD superfamily hydrolase (TIGR01509 family)